MSKVCKQRQNDDALGGEYIMNFDEEDEEDEIAQCKGAESQNFLGRILAGSTSSTEGVVSPQKDFGESNQNY